jgi:hypothetical protein
MAETYKVIILDPSPEDAEKELQDWTSKGFKVVGVYCEDRIILRKQVEIGGGS